MFRNIYFCAIIICQVQYLVLGDISKSSLTFVIDDTGSMMDEISQVKEKTKLVFDAVQKSNASKIDDFILVTFNDPDAKVRTITRDQHEFKRALENINVDGGGDCPEYAMTGIELALEKSKPNSFLYVYTDASAKDPELFERVKSLSLKKSTKVTFLLTGECGTGSTLVYENLALATSGQVFHIQKNDVNKIIDYIIESVKHVKTTLAQKQNIKEDSGKQIKFNVDSKVWDVLISVSAADPNFHVIDADGGIVETEKDKSIYTSTTKIEQVKVKPGVYTIVLESNEPASVIVSGSTLVTFEHGFSTVKPMYLNETATKPVPDEKSYLAIKLNNYYKDVTLKAVELQDLDDNTIMTLPLQLINDNNQFYATESFSPPNKSFKLIVIGYTKEGEKITRLGSTTIEPQNVEFEKIINKLPTVSIGGGYKINAEYDEPLDVKCKIYAYPKPDVIWQDSTGFVWTSKVVPVDLPYEYISILNIDKVNKNSTFTCKATNSQGVNEASIEIETKRKTFLNILIGPTDTIVEYGDSFNFKVVVDAYPPATITWNKDGTPITHDDHYNLSTENSSSTLILKNVDFAHKGNYVVEISNGYLNQNIFFKVAVHAELPKINKSIDSLTFRNGSSAVIKCNLRRGYPVPKISWSFKNNHLAKVVKLDKTEDTLVINNVTKANTGIYICNAYNEIGRDTHAQEVHIEYPPTIDKEDEIVSAMAGQKLKLVCLADGAPSPSIKWFENNVEITSTRKHHIYNGNILRFKVSLDSHGKVYTCEATNKLGKARKNFEMNIYSSIYIEAPEVTNIDVDVGNPLSLTCKVYGVPKPDVHWTFYSYSSDKPKALRADEANTLKIERTQFENEGIYVCMANNSKDPAYLTYDVHVQAKPSIVNTLIDKTLKGVVGDLVLRIPCRTVGNPKPTITWTIDDDNIAIGTDQYDVDREGTLIIKNLDKRAEGTYKCKAKNKLGSATEVFNVEVQEYPNPDGSTKHIFLEEGTSYNIDCDLPHDKKDLLRWFKDGNIISIGEFHLTNAKLSDSGIYTCRVSTFMQSDSSNKKVTVGRKPQFLYEVETEIEYKEGSTVALECDAVSDTELEVHWYRNGRELDETSTEIIFDMSSSDIGNYTCEVSNMFGEIARIFNINQQDCILNIENDFNSKQPFVLTRTREWYPFKQADGVITIPRGTILMLSCPMSKITDKKNIFLETVPAICVEKSIFRINGKLTDFKDLFCFKEKKLITKAEGDSCGKVTERTKLVNVGFKVRSKVLSVYSVCMDIDQKVPVFAKHTLSPSFANIIPKDFINTNFSKSNLLPFDFDFMYDCKNQRSTFFTLRSARIDSCCYKKRQLINPKDVLPGMPQLATYDYLNVVPHWSTCVTENWNEVEERVRNFVQYSDKTLEVWTGSSNTLNSHNTYKYLTDAYDKQPVSPYIWKVLYNPKENEAVAIIQINLADLTQPKAIEKIPCHDICYTIEWMRNPEWYEVDKGFTICCNIQEFQKVFGFNFTNATRVLSQNVVSKYALA